MAARRKITYTITRSPRASTDAAAAVRECHALMQRGERAQARALLERALAEQPAHAELLSLLGAITLIEGDPRQASGLLQQALASDPDHAVAHCNLGLALSRLEQHADALTHYERACALSPHYVEAHSNRGVTLNTLQRFEDAVAAYDRAIELKADHAEAHCNRGVALNNLNRYDEAIASYDRALKLKPDYAAAHWNRCLVRLITGDFGRAWTDYSWRWKKREITYASRKDRPFWYGTARRRGKTDLPQGVPCAFDPPFWDGSPTRGSLLVWPEQGVGEQIMYASMLDEAVERVGSTTLILDPKLHALYRRSFPKCRIVTFEEAMAGSGFDVQMPLGDLGGFFRSGEADFLRHRRAFLKADRARTASLRNELAPGNQRVCGLSWSSRNAEYGAQKTLALELLHPLFSLPDMQFVDLQYGNTEKARTKALRETGTHILRVASVDNWSDIDGLAALISACDIIVTISTTTAHLAGALGKDVLLMLPHSQGRFWYWQADREDALWYPSMRIFRQRAHGDWADVVERVRAALMPAARASRKR